MCVFNDEIADLETKPVRAESGCTPRLLPYRPIPHTGDDLMGAWGSLEVWLCGFLGCLQAHDLRQPGPESSGPWGVVVSCLASRDPSLSELGRGTCRQPPRGHSTSAPYSTGFLY